MLCLRRMTFSSYLSAAARCHSTFTIYFSTTLGGGDGLTLRDLSHTELYKHSGDSSVRSCKVKLRKVTVFVKQWTDGQLVGTVFAERPVHTGPKHCRA